MSGRLPALMCRSEPPRAISAWSASLTSNTWRLSVLRCPTSTTGHDDWTPVRDTRLPAASARRQVDDCGHHHERARAVGEQRRDGVVLADHRLAEEQCAEDDEAAGERAEQDRLGAVPQELAANEARQQADDDGRLGERDDHPRDPDPGERVHDAAGEGLLDAGRSIEVAADDLLVGAVVPEGTLHQVDAGDREPVRRARDEGGGTGDAGRCGRSVAGREPRLGDGGSSHAGSLAWMAPRPIRVPPRLAGGELRAVRQATSRSFCASASDCSFLSDWFSIWRMRSRVTLNVRPTSSSVRGCSPPSP